MKPEYTAPEFKKNAFNCMYCRAYAAQYWYEWRNYNDGDERGGNVYRCQCEYCDKNSVWVNGVIVYPGSAGIQQPSQDLNEDIQKDYLEAASIFQKSPRGAAALLRLAVQKLCKQLGGRGENLNTDIGNLVKKGLPPTIQQSLDIVRVTGNSAVHPGHVDVSDDHKTVVGLFKLINLIAEKMITDPKEVEGIYNDLSSEKKQQIENRDKGNENDI